ncbi:glutamate-cysteine ligase family protein [Halomarina halobia]|uniref:Glutamate-cysteine ligase family protein n=1 Tax=Halomarina halobia TaxID=3033386 RepID=A0ABD6AAR9_9EURY
MKKGIELEYWVIDEAGRLTTPDSLTEVSDEVEQEFVECLFEIKTTPCETIAGLREELVERLRIVLEECDRLNKRLVPLGTPIHGGRIRQRPGDRSRIQERVIGGSFAYARYCAGTHVHFERRDETDQLNVLSALDPALALLSSSPYFQGRRIAADARSYVYRRKGYGRHPRHGQLWDYVDDVEEWNERLDRRYDEFKRAAFERGVDQREVDDHFTSDDAVWTPVRLRKACPTVEWRSPDAALPSETLRLVADVDALLGRLDDVDVRIEGEEGRVTGDAITLPRFERLRDYVDAAIHDGTESTEVRAYLGRMGFDVSSYAPNTHRIDGRDRVTEGEACELRVRSAERLERDVDRLARAG